jgi:hypothetical protein
MNPYPSKVIVTRAIEASPDGLTLILSDRRVAIPWTQCPDSLKNASDSQRRHAILSPGGYGIHWPEIDEDLSIHGLLHLVES